jgi:FMN-dependent NADH-azoreductase
VTGRWIHAAFTKPEQREPWMHEVLAESDALVDELIGADVIVAGVPMYNFGPAGAVQGLHRQHRAGRAHLRLRPLASRRPVLAAPDRVREASRRPEFAWGLRYGDGERIQHLNHVESSIQTAFRYLGITAFEAVAAEYDEFADERLQASLAPRRVRGRCIG